VIIENLTPMKIDSSASKQPKQVAVAKITTEQHGPIKFCLLTLPDLKYLSRVMQRYCKIRAEHLKARDFKKNENHSSNKIAPIHLTRVK
jgi:hypothetical protein